MKKYLSVFALYVRCSICKVTGILLLLWAGQTLYFREKLSDALTYYALPVTENEYGMASMTRSFTRLEDIFTAPFAAMAAAAFLLTVVVLCLPGTSRQAKTGYTLARLGIPERQTFVCQAVYNGAVLLIFWAAEAVLCYLLCRYYGMLAPEDYVSSQTVLLAFYRGDFLHSLLPMADISGWASSLCMLLSLALSTAAFPYFQRRRKFFSDALVSALVTVAFFVRGVGEGYGDAMYIFTALIVIPHILYQLYAFDDEENDVREQETVGAENCAGGNRT